MMSKLTIPFSPLPYPVIEKLSNPFLGLGAGLSKALPYLEMELIQAKFDVDPKRYASVMIFLGIVYFIFFFGFIALVLSRFTELYLLLAFTISAVLSFMIFMQISLYPKMVVKKKIRDLERNLIFALRTMLIQIKSGVSLFDSMTTIANGDYGALSAEFKGAIDEINTGTIEEFALQKLATNNPSLYFRKAIWQIVNGMKAGADVSTVLTESVATMGREQKIAINTYGNQLKVFSLIYMMIGVIVPALGLTFLIVLGSFPQVEIGENLFWALIGFVGVAQFMYIGMIKSKRPNIMSA
ncbi:MAG: type II secretion system F family protein [Candidatus Diapherotrites archaeon]